MNKRFLGILTAAIMLFSLLPTAVFASDYADTVVYGTIYTAETEKPVAEAIAVKDGRYIFVGDEAGAAAFIKNGVTQVIDHRGKGMVMPGSTDGHSHYIMKLGMDSMKGGIMFDLEDDKAAVLKKLAAAALAAKNAGKETLFGFGWSYLTLTNDPPTLKELDDAAQGVSAIIFDQGGHHAFCNSECLKRCGIIDGNGNVLISKIDGGVLELDDKGYPSGYADERVTGYMMRNGGINFDEIIDDAVAETVIDETQKFLLSTGYTMALDGWSNMLHPSKFYETANRLDKNGKLKIVFSMTYEVEPWQTDMDAQIEHLAKLNKTYGTKHVLPQYLKIFMDGVVETGTGAMLSPYKNGTVYKSFWSEARLAEITKKCNEKGLVVHTHTMGDAAIKETADAYIQGGDGTHRNCMVHLRNVRPEDFKRFAENNIACSAGMTWHAASVGQDEYMATVLEDKYAYYSYPIKSFFDAGVKVSSHSDFPANIPCPQDPFGIMHVAVNGMVPDPLEGEKPYDTDELITVDQAFQALTINGAWQLGLEDERGSIKVGKYADFVLADRDIFKCQKTDIGKTKVVSTWFEGEKVYDASEYAVADGTATFADVKASDYCYDAVLWAAENGITTGTDATHFSPNMGTTRAQVVTFLWRAAGSPEPTGNASKFTDVTPREYYAKAVAWAIEKGITKGTGETAFSPDKVCTRAQIVTFLARFAGVADADTASAFADVNNTDYFAAAVKWAKDNKVTEGTSATTFSPNADCTRAQVVTFLWRLMMK